MIMNKTIMKCMVLGLLFAGCENGDKEFDDYEYQTISFATQTPIRTITLGEDVYPTEQDNEYRMQIIATLGGVWSNRKERTAQIVIDESLCTNAYFDNGKPILPMPKEYYTYSSEQVVFPKGDIYGRMDIQLTDAFFNDPLTPELTYVIPVRLAQASMSPTLYSVRSLASTSPFFASFRSVIHSFSAICKDFPPGAAQISTILFPASGAASSATSIELTSCTVNQPFQKQSRLSR